MNNEVEWSGSTLPLGSKVLPLAAVIALSLICVLADFLLKVASQAERPFVTKAFFIGTALYAVSAVGWVYVLQHVKLATVGALYSVVLVICLAVVGTFGFRESLSTGEVVGLGCAIAALVLLARFS